MILKYVSEKQSVPLQYELPIPLPLLLRIQRSPNHLPQMVSTFYLITPNRAACLDLHGRALVLLSKHVHKLGGEAWDYEINSYEAGPGASRELQGDCYITRIDFEGGDGAENGLKRLQKKFYPQWKDIGVLPTLHIRKRIRISSECIW